DYYCRTWTTGNDVF
nr:immunoglobulin light chain junction region [Macaca mulatta]MOY17013.1 immunoglobulin light chain junction region [Macaca mulatta]